MRTRVALIFICCAIFISCEPIDEYDDCIWRVKNNTDKAIVFNTIVNTNVTPWDIPAGDSTIIQNTGFSNNEIPFWYALERKDSVTISINDQIKKIWRRHDDKSGRHFYNQSSWFFYKTFRKKGFENYNFTFTIEESDLD